MYIAKVTTYKRGRNVQVAKRPGGETSCEGAKRPGGETSKGRNVHKPFSFRTGIPVGPGVCRHRVAQNTTSHFRTIPVTQSLLGSKI